MILGKDNLKLGLVLGLLGPILGIVIIYFVKFSAGSFGDFLDLVIHTNRLITSIGSLSLLANAVLFTIYINMHKDDTAKGIFIMTMLYGIAILVLKIV